MLEDILMVEMGRSQMDKAVTWVGNDPERYAQLWNLALRNEDPISRRAVWALDIHYSQWPEMFTVPAEKVLEVLESPCHPALLRHLIKMLSLREPIPEALQGELFDLGLSLADDASRPAAIRVHGMELAGKIALPYPELLQELEAVLKAHYDESSAGFKSRARKWLKRIELM